MRRLAFFLLSATALAALPAAALASRSTPGDGSLVVKHGVAPSNVPVVQMKITGTVIGEVDSPGKIIIDTGINGPTPSVTGDVGAPHPPATDPNGTANVWNATGIDGFKFRVVGGSAPITVLVYGTDVNVVAIGRGSVKLAGTPNSIDDGKYSLNGDDFKSLPGSQTDRLTISANG